MAVAVAFDWNGNHFLAERVLNTVSNRAIKVLYHFGNYGVINDEGRNWYVERIDYIAHQYDITVFVTPGESDALDPATLDRKPRPLLRHTLNQFCTSVEQRRALASLQELRESSSRPSDTAVALVRLLPTRIETEWVEGELSV